MSRTAKIVKPLAVFATLLIMLTVSLLQVHTIKATPLAFPIEDFESESGTTAPTGTGGNNYDSVSFSGQNLDGVVITELEVVLDGSLNYIAIDNFEFGTALIATPSPVLTTYTPISNTISAPVTTTVSITYDVDMDASTVSTETFAVHAMSTGLLTQTYSVNGSSLTLTPNSAFKPGELVQVSATTATLSISSTSPSRSTVWQFWAAAGDGPGTFPPGNNIGGDNDYMYSVALGDVDGDGDLDIVAGYWGFQNVIYLNDGDGTFDTTSHNFGPGNDGTTSVALGDMDGDGDLDIVVGNGSSNPNRQNVVYLNDGDGTFDTTSHNFGPADVDTQSVALGDVDGDGDLDIVVGNSVAGSNNGSINPQNVIYLNDGDGTFDTTSHNFGTESDYTNSVVMGDVDGDGDLDIVTGSFDQNVIYLNDSDGTFDTTSRNFGTGTDDTESIALGDVDGDGDLDIAVGNRTGGQNVLYLNDGDGTFDTTSRNFGTGDDDTNTVALGDVDGDGDLDIAVGNYNEPDVIYLNNGDGTFATSGNPIGEGTSRINANIDFALGDVDGDGDLDIVVANLYEQSVVYANAQLVVADVSITKTVSSPSAPWGTPITYTLSFANADTSVTAVATDVVITDSVPVSVTNVSFINSGAIITQTGIAPDFVWQVQDLSPGEGGIITITGVLSNPLALGTFTNTATITMMNEDNNPANNSAQVALEVVHNIDFLACPTSGPIYVDRDAVSGADNGGSWDNALTSLQAGLALARKCADVDEIWVAEGTYTPGVTAADSFNLVSGVALYGGFAATETLRSQRDYTANLTILSGDLADDDTITTEGYTNPAGTNSYHVVYADGTTIPITESTVLDGFTISGGYALPVGGAQNGYGAGLFCDGDGSGSDCSPTLTNLIFSGNTAIYRGGAIYSRGSNGGRADLQVTNTAFTYNQMLGGGGTGYGGGAIYNDNSDVTLISISFTANKSPGSYGGAIYNDTSSLTLTNTTFITSTALQGGIIYNSSSSLLGENNSFAAGRTFSGCGGALCNMAGSSVVLTNTIFTGNLSGTAGGAVDSGDSNLRLFDTTFTASVASSFGGALYINGGSLLITNSRFLGNSAGAHGGALYNDGVDSVMIANTIFSGNESGEFGGAIGNTNSNPQLTNVTISGNRARSAPGGAVANGASSSVHLVNGIM